VQGALLFELEGVIVDTLLARATALRDALAAEGIALTDVEAIDASRGRAVRRAIASAAHAARVSYDLVTIDLAAARAEALYASRVAASGFTLRPGAVEFVRHAQASTRCALVTRASRQETETAIRLAGLEDAFEAVVTLEDVVEEKPAPAAYRAMLARLEKRRALPRRGMVAIEDGADGARSARVAGLTTLVVGPAPASDALEADAYLPSLEGATMETIRALAARAGANVP